MNNKEKNYRIAHEALTVLAAITLLSFMCRLWPIILLALVGTIIAVIRLLFLKARTDEPTDVRQLCTHYRVVDAYIRFLMSERQLGSKTDEDGQKKRETAMSAFIKVVQDYQRRFSSFQATTPDQYKKVIENTINAVLPVWAQYRTTYISL